MKKKLLTILLSILAAVAVLAVILYVIPAFHEKECKNRVYSDMEEQLDTVRDSVIGIIPMTEENGNISYGGGGSGVIFDQQGDTYYAVTALHCVSKANSTFKIYTTATPLNTVEGLGDAGDFFNIMDESFYESLADATVEYISDTTDLAIVSFTSEDSLTVAEIADDNPQVGDHLMCIGNPGGDKFVVTYGEVTSEPKTITSVSKTGDDGAGTLTYSAMEHNAYIYSGNSGGPAFNSDMKVAGINTSGSVTLLGMFDTGDMVPCTDVQECIAEWRK